jgi:hypothetical protein
MHSQSKGIGSADISASMCREIRTIPALLHCASHRWDNGPPLSREPRVTDLLAFPVVGHGSSAAAAR